MTIVLNSPGMLTTIQDLGRFGYQRFGVPTSGPMDRFAFTAGNRLVNNPDNTPGLEFTLQGPVCSVFQDCLVAVTGPGFSLFVDQQCMPSWTAVLVRYGQKIEVKKTGEGNWGYLCISGGIIVENVMGSSATDMKGKFGGINGRPLLEDMTFTLGEQPESFLEIAGRSIPGAEIPEYQSFIQLDVVPGPQEDSFTRDGLDTFFSNTYQVSPTSDRMGYRLEGSPIEHTHSADIISEGMIPGSIQVPASGQPIIMMAEHPTTGGYTKIATVTSYHLPLLAQCPIGVGKIRFIPVTIEEAQQKLKLYLGKTDHIISGPIDQYFSNKRF